MSKFGPAPKIVHGNGKFPLPDPAVKKVEDDFITKSKGIQALDSLSLTPAFPARPAHGDGGQAITIWANFFDVKTGPNLVYFKYSIEVTPDGKAPKPSKTRTKQILVLLLEDQQDLHGVYTDSRSNMYSLERLGNIPREVVIPYRAQGEDVPSTTPAAYRIRIKDTGTTLISQYLDYLKSAAANHPQFPQRDDALQTLNIVLGNHPHLRADIATIGQNKHYPIDPPVWKSLTGGLHAIRGIYTSVRPATNRLLLNVNASHTVCHAPVLLSTLIRETNLRHDLLRLSRRLRLVRVQRLHLPVRKNKAGKIIPSTAVVLDVARTFDGQSEANPPQVLCDGAGPKDVKFYLAASQTLPAAKGLPGKPAKGAAVGTRNSYISVWDYFTKTYPNIKMSADLPVVNAGDHKRPIYLPVEACQVLPGQSVAAKLNANQTREMIQFACRKPSDNADSIVRDGGAVLGLQPPKNPALGKVELNISPALITVQARVLQSPQIQYFGKKSLHPAKGSWNMQEGMKFYKPGSLGTWTYIDIRSHGSPAPTKDGMDELHMNVLKFAESMRKVGMSVPAPIATLRLSLSPDGNDKLEPCFKFLTENQAIRFLLIVLPSSDTTTYGRLKSMADRINGFHTVCVLREKFMNTSGQDRYFSNVAMKFNLKAGGINQVLDPFKMGIIKDGTTMVVGIDVTHPSPQSQSNAPSVAGVVASIDGLLGQWPSITRVQTGRTEMVADLELMVKSRLTLWQKHNKVLPRNILVYRDGVSEGQYQLVLDEEIPQLRAACRTLYPSKSPPAISFIIVGKRHHVRFYPTNTNDCDEKSNCKNGTIVDRGITEVRFWDFYLQAHACLQGTARSAHYYVILDEIFRKKAKTSMGNPANALEELTHNMCHLFGRATKAVSVCPPAYYADLVCERSRHYLSNYFDPPLLADVPPALGDDGESDLGRPRDGKAMAKAKDGRAEDDRPLPDDKMRRAITISPRLVDSMYYI